MESIKSFNQEIIRDLQKTVEKDSTHRYKSWEYCYKAFQTETDVDLLSLHLGFYLASWGMYRGSSGLLQKDYTIHKGAVQILLDNKYKSIHFTASNPMRLENEKSSIELILQLKKELSEYYGEIEYTKGDNDPKTISPTDTLISKIMLGTLGCSPAYDRYYIKGLRASDLKGIVYLKSR